MRFIFIVLLLVSISSSAQTLWIKMTVDRVVIDTLDGSHERFTARVLMVQEGKNVGIYTTKDTMYLVPVKTIWEKSHHIVIYADAEHDYQSYVIKSFDMPGGNVVFIIPHPPFIRRRVVSLTLSIP